jgi:DNA-binding transcriptional ArsR family regulator
MWRTLHRSGDGQNGRMPTTVPYPSDVPSGVEPALRALSAPTRVLTLRYLIEHPESTAAEVTAGTVVRSAYDALVELERLGLVDADRPKGARNGTPVRYSVNSAALGSSLDALHSWLSPRSDA